MGEALGENVILAMGAGPVGADIFVTSLDRSGYVTSTSTAAMQLALSILWSADVLLIGAGMKPLAADLALAVPNVFVPTELLLLKDGTPHRVGDIVELNYGGQIGMLSTGTRRDASGRLDLDPRRAAILYAYAARRAVRTLVRTSRIYTGEAQPQLDEARLQPPAVPGQFGVFPIGWVVVGVVLLGSALIAGNTWKGVEEKRSDVALKVADLEQAAKVKVACDLARVSITSGKSVSVPDIIESMGHTEQTQTSYLAPVAIGGGLLVVGVGAALKYFEHKRKSAAS